MDNFFNIILNGKNTKAYVGESILDVAKRNGTEIPTLCHDPRLEPYSSCYVCVVEVEGMRGLQPSCSTKVNEGMKITTNSEKITKARKTALDLIVSNHYADCVAPCKQTCPAGVDIQGYISLMEKGLYREAIGLIKETNPLPAICGRVCVRPCEVACRRNLMDENTGVGIDYLKRFAADQDLTSGNSFMPEKKESTGKKIAIIGAGPGGLSSAFFLQQQGHQCDIYEAKPNPGGWLRYGIPEYRLPNDILDMEVKAITDLGTQIFYTQNLGENLSYKELADQYDATILTIGSQKGTLLGCEGEDAENVFSGIDFLRNMEVTGQRYDFSGKKVAVVGGGNTAMDCCRTSIRCEAEKVYVIYRRTEKEMPANPIEIHESKLEGVEYLFLTNPNMVNKDKKGAVKSVTCLKMELGEPDASGRRRPVPVEGSDFDLEVDFILAAIGQKTDVNFIEDINTFAKKGQLAVNRWGDIDADKTTLQTGIENVFAAGDGVTGPATIIEAIAQAQKASRSCHQYLMELPLEPEKKEFISTKDHYKEQKQEEYVPLFSKQLRHEMPVMEPEKRNNFEEVELGYENEEVAQKETHRCLECGCTEYFSCDLKRYATEYGAEQEKYKGEFKEYAVDFSHPFVEIDNNKCILCARCVRICHEVVGANALGLVERGYDTFVAPSMGNSLKDASCESCGLCISACPTGAITENVPFKPGPVKLQEMDTICNYCSTGCEITLHHKTGFVMKTTGKEGLVNADGNLCRFPKFGYHYINSSQRITQPLWKKNGQFTEITFDQAYDIIAERIKKVRPDENAFFAGARLTNEEIYLIQKLSRNGAKTHNMGSFHYLGRGEGYRNISKANVPFSQIPNASRIYILGSELNTDQAVVGFIVNNTRIMHGVPVELVTADPDNRMKNKVDQVIPVRSYYHFVKALNFYYLKNDKQNGLFIKDHTDEFENYKTALLQENYAALLQKAGIEDQAAFEVWAENLNNEMNAVIIFSEKEVSSNTGYELYNLAMITGKLGKTASGLIALKEKNNSQGLIDMGANPDFGVGNNYANDPVFVEMIKKVWKTENYPESSEVEMLRLLQEGKLKNLFVFGEDPVGCAMDKDQVNAWFTQADFRVVQDHFLTETAQQADLILPASFHFESGGMFTNTQKTIQQFEPTVKPKSKKTNGEQLIDLLQKLGSTHVKNEEEARMEIFALLPEVQPQTKYNFVHTEEDNPARLFDYGCDYLVKQFEENFEKAYKE